MRIITWTIVPYFHSQHHLPYKAPIKNHDVQNLFQALHRGSYKLNLKTDHLNKQNTLLFKL